MAKKPNYEQNEYLDDSIAVQRLTRDLAKSAATMTEAEVKFLVQHYYISQDNRIRFDAQVRELVGEEKPHMLLGYLGDQSDVLESQIKRALDKYTDAHPIGTWIKSLYGFGPVLAAGFLAHIDIKRAPTAGHIWSYAGLNPERTWEKGQKRPWNAELKKLVWKAGECMVKFSNAEDCYYGHLFKERKEYEWRRNFARENIDKANGVQKTYGDDTEASAWTSGCYKAADIERHYNLGGKMDAAQVKHLKGAKGSGDPMLPPAQLHARARRYAMKMFLSHLHEVWYEHEFKCRVPKPFVIQHMGHVHRIAVPGYVSPYAQNEPSPVDLRKAGR